MMICINQYLSGFLLAIGFVEEPMIIPASRDTDDIENIHFDDLYWLHERGVDFIFLLIYLHLFRKMYVSVVYIENEVNWKSGIINLLILQVVVFLGLLLTSTHLSDITLRVGYNTLVSFLPSPLFDYFEWIFLTDGKLNTDNMARIESCHYLFAGALIANAFQHSHQMHYDWKGNIDYSGCYEAVNWLDTGVFNEVFKFYITIAYVWTWIVFLYNDPETIWSDIFSFGDVGYLDEVKYEWVAPHWYFRGFMAFLTAMPHHYYGIFGIFFFYITLYIQPNLINYNSKKPLGNYNLEELNIQENISLETRNSLKISYKYFFTSIYRKIWLFIKKISLAIKHIIILKEDIKSYNDIIKDKFKEEIDLPMESNLKKAIRLSKEDDYFINQVKLNENYELLHSHYSVSYNIRFSLFVATFWHNASFLPFALFYHTEGGCFTSFIAYTYMFTYLLFPSLRGRTKYNNECDIRELRRLNNIAIKRVRLEDLNEKQLEKEGVYYTGNLEKYIY